MTLGERVPTVDDAGRDGLTCLLRRLDDLLERAVAAARDAYGAGAGANPFRGLTVTRDEVEGLLAREPGQPAFSIVSGPEDEGPGDTRLVWLARRFGLAAFDLDVVLIALAPEIDLRYERIFGYLHDDVTRRRPSIDLVLNVLCPSDGSKRARRWHFGADAPLLRHGLVRLDAEPNHGPCPLLGLAITLDDQVVRMLLDVPGLDPRLTGFATLAGPGGANDWSRFDAPRDRALVALADRAQADRYPLRLYFRGESGSGRRAAAGRLADELGAPLLTVDLAAALVADPGLEWVPGLATREAGFQGAILYVNDWDAIGGVERAGARRRLADRLGEVPEPVILAGRSPWRSEELAVTPVHFERPDFPRRRACWEACLADAGVAIENSGLDALASRFRLSAERIEASVASAVGIAQWTHAQGRRSTNDDDPTLDDLSAAARAHSGHVLESLARKVEPRAGWDDLILPDDAMAQLREIVRRVALRHRVWEDGGFRRRLSQGQGVNALFAGPPGTGKTMAAEVVAGALGLDLYKIDLSRVVSKWVGETEKHLHDVFEAAEGGDAVLLFDEADALFGKRAEVRDAHDRYANMETSYLLQKMEQFEGVALLATNMPGNMDDAFTRRLTATVHFPFPDEPSRLRLWQGIWPAETALAEDVNLAGLAARFKLSGGHIKNVALAAAFLAADESRPVARAHLLHAVRREYQKMGKILSDDELGVESGRPTS